MAQKVQFLGFKRALTGAQMQDNYLYFLRDAGEREGKLWFNGVCYGSCRDTEIDKVLEALEGFIPASGEVTNVKEYIDEAIAQLERDVTTIELGDGSFSGLTLAEDSSTSGKLDYTLTLTNVAPKDEFDQEKIDRAEADEALDDKIDAVSAATETALEEEAQAREDADTALQNELDAVEAAVGLSTGGTHVQSTGRYTSAATTTEGEIAALDTALQAVADKTITEGSSTEDYVKLDVATTNGNTVITINDSALTAAIQAMDYSGVTANGQAIVNVTEADGKITATQGDIAAEHVTIADAGELFTATNVEAALAEIDAAYKAADAAIVGDASESGNTLGKLEDRIEALDADAKEYHIVKTTTGLPAAIKERYSLVDADGNVSGDTVDIPKDSHIVSINYITTSGDPHYQNLEYVYIDASGETKTVYVDMSQLVLESEFASGVTSIDGVVRGVVDPQSETFLTVGANGFKLSGVQDAIDDAKTAATAYTQSEIQKLDVTGDTAVAGQYVAAIEETDGVVAVKTRANVSDAVLNGYAKGTDATAVAATDTVNQAISKLENQVDKAKAAATTKVVEGTDAGNNLEIVPTTGADSSVTYTVNLTDVASASALTKEISDREAADDELQNNLQTTADTLTDMIEGLTNGLQAELNAVESSLGFNDTAYTQNEKINISGRTVTEDIHLLDVALGETNNNIADLQDALETTANTLTAKIEDEASARAAADEALDARLDVVEEKYITAVTVNGVAATVTGNAADVTIDAGDVELGTPITGNTGDTLTGFTSGETVDEVLQGIVDAINGVSSSSYTGVTSNDKSINITRQTNGQDLSVNVKTLQLADVQAGETEVKKDESTGALYGVMYWIDEETNNG